MRNQRTACMTQPIHKPGPDVLRRIEELLREELAGRGIDANLLPPHEISEHMRCGVHPDGALSYVWKGEPVLDVVPEKGADGKIRWKLLARRRDAVQ